MVKCLLKDPSDEKYAISGSRFVLDPIYTGLVTTVQVLYLLEICCLG